MKGVRNTNITRALRLIEDMARIVKREHPTYNKIRVALEIAGGFNSKFYNVVILILNEIDLEEK